MAAGYEVTKFVLDSKTADAILSLRAAFTKVETVAKWLALYPNITGEDPLVAEFGYTEVEMYHMRTFFSAFESVRLKNLNVFEENGRQLTGLE